MKRKVFWTGIEYSYMIGSEEYGNLKGGFVYVFIKAFDAKEALNKITHKLNKIKLEPIEVEFLKPYEIEMAWDTSKQTNYYLNLYKEADDKDEIIFDKFYAYKHD